VLDRAPKGAVEVVLSYCHHSLNDTSLLELVPYLQDKGVGIISASPCAFGIEGLSYFSCYLVESSPPAVIVPWVLESVLCSQAACAQATEVCKAHGKSIAQLALQYALRNRNIVTTLVGMSSVDVVSCLMQLKCCFPCMSYGGENDVEK
jgi:L-galactose dehydrogenase